MNFWILKTNQIRKQKEEGNIIPHIWFVKYFKVENSEKRLQAMAEQITCLLVQANWSNTSWLAAETDIFTYLCATCTEAAFIHGISHNMHCRRSEENWQIYMQEQHRHSRSDVSIIARWKSQLWHKEMQESSWTTKPQPSTKKVKRSDGKTRREGVRCCYAGWLPWWHRLTPHCYLGQEVC